jgi:hypothetical protein
MLRLTEPRCTRLVKNSVFQSSPPKPVAAISIELESPTDWDPYKPESEAEESRILNAIRSAVGDQIDAYSRDVLVRDPRQEFWLPAYETIHGPGTQVRRARAVSRILEDRAQLPDEGLGKFTKDVWGIVEKTITEVCSPKGPTRWPQPAGGPSLGGRSRQSDTRARA